MVDLIINNGKKPKTVPVPERWDEMTAEQLTQVSAVLFSDDTQLGKHLRLINILCRLNWKQIIDLPENYIFNELKDIVGWLYDRCDLTAQLLPDLDGAWFGPAAFLSNITFQEFDDAERRLYHWHCEPDNLSLLWQFIAVLYRPAKRKYNRKINPDGDIRQPFNAAIVDHHAGLISRRHPLATAYAILLFYKGCREYITERFSRIFKSGTANQSEIPEEPAYFGLMRSIAKEGIYGKYADVEKLFLYTALTEMEEALDERERLEAAYEEARQNAGR